MSEKSTLQIDHLDHLDPVSVFTRCCAGSVRMYYRANPGNML